MKLDPEPGDFVKIRFKDIPQSEEGIVVFWNKERAIIKAQGSNNKLIINKPEDNILAIKIVVELNEPLDIAQTQELEPDKYYKKEELRALNLAQLRKLQGKEERERARELLTTFKAQGLPAVDYDKQLDVSKLKPISYNPLQKIRLHNQGTKKQR